MDRFSIHFCDSEKVVNIEFDNYLPGGTGYTIGWEGGVLEIPYMGCVSSLTGDFVSYNIGSTAITVTIAPNATVSSINHNLTIHWCNGDDTAIVVEQGHQVLNGYFGMKSIGTCLMRFNKSPGLTKILYSSDGGYTFRAFPTSGIQVSSGVTIYFRGDLKPYHETGGRQYGIGTFTNLGRFEVFGNPMSLTDEFNFDEAEMVDYQFLYLFSGCTGLVNASNLMLSSMTLTVGCYQEMFAGCTSLTGAPVLPATTLAGGCYASMFRSCTSLTTAPSILPATTLAGGCYQYMFRLCTSLATAPSILPATTLAGGCYQGMFEGCESLTTAPELPATTLAENCYRTMFSACTSLTTVQETLPATTLADNCYSSMFYGCTSLTTAPELPATALTTGCYNSMFSHCSSLTTAPELPAPSFASYCYTSMFYLCTRLNRLKCLTYQNYSANDVTDDWLKYTSEEGTFIKSSSATHWQRGGSGIPNGWTVIEVD